MRGLPRFRLSGGGSFGFGSTGLVTSLFGSPSDGDGDKGSTSIRRSSSPAMPTDRGSLSSTSSIFGITSSPATSVVVAAVALLGAEDTVAKLNVFDEGEVGGACWVCLNTVSMDCCWLRRREKWFSSRFTLGEMLGPRLYDHHA